MFDIYLLISSLWNFGSSTLTPIIVINFLHHQRSRPFNLEVAIRKIPDVNKEVHVRFLQRLESAALPSGHEPLYLTLRNKRQIDGEDFVNFRGLLRKYEL